LDEGRDSETAVRLLSDQLEEAARHQADQWRIETEPELEHEWRRLAGLSNTNVRLTTDELDRLQQAIDELLGPYVQRAEPPANARWVRILRHYLPEAAQ
jgi:hypothetical protein